MAKSSRVREALISKKSWSKQQLSARAQQITRRLPMATGDAHAVIAHQEGIKIERYLERDDLSRVQSLIAKLNGMGSGSTPDVSSASPRRRSSLGSSRSTGRTMRRRMMVFPGELTLEDPLLSESKIQEAREMAEIYPVLYVLENSIREVVKRVMKSKYGDDWWNTALTSGKVKELKDKSDQRRRKENQMSWHQRRGAHPIDYIDFGQLGDIIAAKQDDFFPHVLGEDRAWFENFMRELVPSRNVLCHMNPLVMHNAADVRIKAARWATLIEARLANIQ